MVHIMKARYGVTRSQRRKFLEKLAFDHMLPEVQNRSKRYSSTAGVSKYLQDSFQLYGFAISPSQAEVVKRPPTKGRCQICPRSADKKSRMVCCKCGRSICSDHSVINTSCNPDCD